MKYLALLVLVPLWIVFVIFQGACALIHGWILWIEAQTGWLDGKGSPPFFG